MFDSIAFAFFLAPENLNPFKPAVVDYNHNKHLYYKPEVLCRQSVESDMKNVFDLLCLFSILLFSIFVLLSLSSYVVLTFGFVLAITTILVSFWCFFFCLYNNNNNKKSIKKINKTIQISRTDVSVSSKPALWVNAPWHKVRFMCFFAFYQFQIFFIWAGPWQMWPDLSMHYVIYGVLFLPLSLFLYFWVMGGCRMHALWNHLPFKKKKKKENITRNKKNKTIKSQFLFNLLSCFYPLFCHFSPLLLLSSYTSYFLFVSSLDTVNHIYWI